ncbi:hypothetical protein [Peptostreptococcus canis]|uniref:Uncharacterized protein n=1 Tax=Peptostreptococcus canis TaxID=1159213 RepID=A0ABR6TM40_9FIRM|nr:hypothetical protein [Peptostreptococcus canis]MBC2576479.1 hypothetical protein [Peptostreptococcus canis]MBP1998685.1 hypothetical protein [Peptostreptococcus canis]
MFLSNKKFEKTYVKKDGFASIDIVFALSFFSILIYVFSVYTYSVNISLKNHNSLKNELIDEAEKEKEYILSLTDDDIYQNHEFMKLKSMSIRKNRYLIDSKYGLIKTNIEVVKNGRKDNIEVYSIIGE